jgi:DNA invertase Pin-like site-specific DNA recombinase
MVHLALPLPVAVIVAAIIETLGLSTVPTALWAYDWNAHKRKTDPGAPVPLSVALSAVYSMATLGLVVFLEVWPSLAAYAPAIFPALAVVGALNLALIAQQEPREASVKVQKAELKAARQVQRRGKPQVSNEPKSDRSLDTLIVKRDALQDMLAKARQLAPSRKELHPEAPDGILFWDTRRLGRDQVDNAFIKADLRRRGYVLIFLSDDIPDVGDFTPVIEAFLDWKAEQDLKDIGKDAQRGLHDLARKGYHPGGFPPRGYKAEQVQVDVKRNGDPRYAPRIVAKVEVKKDRGTLYLRVPLRAVLSVGTPGATRTPAHGSGGRRSIH